mmetsp:Transcript_20154/g.39358  ORF Transcript_20154/g.39358 Transcript_20154/m.39358 type:complete len:94 (-) Transcript_20154:286-567(-)
MPLLKPGRTEQGAATKQTTAAIDDAHQAAAAPAIANAFAVNAECKLHQLRMIPSNFVWNHFMPSSFFSLCWKPILPFLNLRHMTRDPGLDRCT